MDKIKEIIKEKNFVINPLILKNIKNFDLSVNELLVLLFFINVKNELDLLEINKYTSLSEEEVMSSFDLLVQKNLIEVIVKKINNKISEEISLEIFYNKLLLNIPEDKKETDVFEAFESEFGRTLSPIEYETINRWLENNVSEETIKLALKEAVISGVVNLRYIDKIIYDWTKKKVKIDKKSDEEIKVFDYNWLEDDNESN